MAGIALQTLHVGRNAVFDNFRVRFVAVAAPLGRLFPLRQAVHRVAGAAGESGPVMHVRQHLQEGLAIDSDAALVTHVVLARRPSRVIPTGIVAAMTALAIGDLRLCQRMPGTVAIETVLYMAGIAILLPEAGIHLGVTALDETTLSVTPGHGMVKDALVPAVAFTTANGPVPGGSRACLALAFT